MLPQAALLLAAGEHHVLLRMTAGLRPAGLHAAVELDARGPPRASSSRRRGRQPALRSSRASRTTCGKDNSSAALAGMWVRTAGETTQPPSTLQGSPAAI